METDKAIRLLVLLKAKYLEDTQLSNHIIQYYLKQIHATKQTIAKKHLNKVMIQWDMICQLPRLSEMFYVVMTPEVLDNFKIRCERILQHINHICALDAKPEVLWFCPSKRQYSIDYEAVICYQPNMINQLWQYIKNVRIRWLSAPLRGSLRKQPQQD